MKTTRFASPNGFTKPVATCLLLSLISLPCFVHADEAIPNRAPLKPTVFIPLDLGSVQARGWLADQLRRQADGLTGHAEELLPDLGANSGWLGGKGEGWERGAYYVKGLVALAYVTKDPDLIAKAKKWIDWTLENQRPDGQIGPKNNDDWWPRMVITWALRDYYEATKDPRVLTVLTKYAHFMQDNLPQRPLKEWGKARSGDQIDTLFWLYNRTGEPFLLETADLLIKQSNDWKAYYTTLRQPPGDFFNNHGVNVSEGLKYPLALYQRTGDQADHDLYLKAWKLLNRRHGLIFGMWSGTEALESKSTTQGVEMCSIAEQMLSHEIALSVVGDPVLGDLLERLTYNLLPGGITKDFHQFQYYTLVNQPNAHAADKWGVAYGFGNDHGNDIVPGPASGYACCCFNLHMAWPKFVQHLWMASPDGGLAAVVYGPSEVSTTVGKTNVTLIEETDYPFADGVRITVKTDQAVAFPLRLRIPGWAVVPRVTVNGVAVAEVKPGTFLLLARTWKSGDVVVAEFPAHLSTTNGINGSAALWRGPLVFSLRIGEKATVNRPWKPGFEELVMDPTTPWNYALDLDRVSPETMATVVRNSMPKNPWLPATTPITLTVPAKRLPGWGLTHNDFLAAEVPASPALESSMPSRVGEPTIGGSSGARMTRLAEDWGFLIPPSGRATASH